MFLLTEQKRQRAPFSCRVDVGVPTAGIVRELGAAPHFPRRYFLWRAAEQGGPRFQPLQRQPAQTLRARSQPMEVGQRRRQGAVKATRGAAWPSGDLPSTSSPCHRPPRGPWATLLPSGSWLALLVPADSSETIPFLLGHLMPHKSGHHRKRNTDRQDLYPSAESCYSVSQLTSPCQTQMYLTPSSSISFSSSSKAHHRSEMWKSQG